MNNNSCPRSPVAIVSVTISIHAHNNKEVLNRVNELLSHGLKALAPSEAIAAETFQDLVAEYKVSEPIWSEHILTEAQAMNIDSKPDK